MTRNYWRWNVAAVFALAITFTAASANAVLVEYWKFDVGAGVTPNEVGALGATPTNGAGYNLLSTPDGMGTSAETLALGTPNVLDWFAVGDTTSLDGVDTFTISAWVNPTDISATDRAHIFTKDQSVEFGFEDGGFALRINNGARNITTGTVTALGLPDGNWHHVAVVYNNPTVDYYLDGTLFESVVNPDGSNPNDVGNSLGFGNRPDEPDPNDQFDLQYFGLFDEISVWNNSLSAGEIALLAVAGTDARAIPEPSTLVLAGLGLLGLVGVAFRRARRQSA